MYTKARAFNHQTFLEFLCYAVFSGVTFYLVGSGSYLSYVTPRMEPYLYFAATIMGIWALVGLGRLFKPKYKVRAAHCFVLVIPILLLLLPHGALNTSDLSGNYTGGNVFSGQSAYGTTPSGNSGFSAATSTPTAESSARPTLSAAVAETDQVSEETATPSAADTVAPDAQTDAVQDDASTNLPGLDTENKKITVSNDDFGMWLSELYANTQKYEGYTVVITGSVFKDSEAFTEDEFVPARLMMTCCTADLQLVGLLCKYDEASGLEQDSWVTVEGTLFTGKYQYDGQEYDEPELTVTKITPAEEVEGYVYPY